ncbi:MAG: hypothetical protein WCK35_28520 [Chloroflexota bacterium]
MSEIIKNLKEKYPHNAAYLVGHSSINVFPDLTDDQSKSIGTLPPGQLVYVDFTIIVPDKLFPDWWVWGSLTTINTPKYICMRKPIRNQPSLEGIGPVFAFFRRAFVLLARRNLTQIITRHYFLNLEVFQHLL